MDGEFFLQRLRKSSAGSNLTHFLLKCPACEPLRHANAASSIFTSVLDLGLVRLLGLRGVPRASIPRMGSVEPPPLQMRLLIAVAFGGNNSATCPIF